MKKSLLFLIFFVGVSTQAFAKTACFIVKENDVFLKQEGTGHERYPPCSTFKIPLSLMGYEAGILMDELHPEWPFETGYLEWLKIWKQPHNPTSWIKNSCLWYSQRITTQLGLERFKKYIADFKYGNQDVSGDKGKDNGLTHSWLSSSLKISGFEQIAFLEKLIQDKLPVSGKAQQFTRNILFIEDLANGWKLYGKTGGGFVLNDKGLKNKDRQTGWFIGWLQKEDRRIIFVHYSQDDQKMNSSAGRRAKEIAKEKLLQIIKADEAKKIK